MRIKNMQLGMLGTNCYIFWDENSRVCGIVDPGDNGEKIADFVQGQGLEPAAVLLTHGHFDHIQGIPGLRARWPGLTVYCHPADVDEAKATTTLFGVTFPTVACYAPITPYREGDRVSIGPLTVDVLETPGHTPGCVTLRTGDVLFTGDTLFRGSMGRTDFEGGSGEQMMASLARLGRLEGDYLVYPGHDSHSTLDEERRYNPCLRQAMGNG